MIDHEDQEGIENSEQDRPENQQVCIIAWVYEQVVM